MRAIAVAASKGGAGKTTLAVNLSAALAAKGRRVLLVDCDPQGAAAAALGVPAMKPTINEVLRGSEETAAAIRTTAVPSLDLLPADLDLAGMEEFVLPRWPTLLRDALGVVAGRYDVTLLDAPAGFGPLTRMALVAATAVLIACPPRFLEYRTVRQVMAMVDEARETSGALKVLGLVPTFVTYRSRQERDVLAALRADYPGLLLTPVPRRSAVADAQAAGRPINVYAPGSDAAVAFASLADDVLSRST